MRITISDTDSFEGMALSSPHNIKTEQTGGDMDSDSLGFLSIGAPVVDSMNFGLQPALFVSTQSGGDDDVSMLVMSESEKQASSMASLIPSQSPRDPFSPSGYQPPCPGDLRPLTLSHTASLTARSPRAFEPLLPLHPHLDSPLHSFAMPLISSEQKFDFPMRLPALPQTDDISSSLLQLGETPKFLTMPQVSSFPIEFQHSFQPQPLPNTGIQTPVATAASQELPPSMAQPISLQKQVKKEKKVERVTVVTASSSRLAQSSASSQQQKAQKSVLATSDIKHNTRTKSKISNKLGRAVTKKLKHIVKHHGSKKSPDEQTEIEKIQNETALTSLFDMVIRRGEDADYTKKFLHYREKKRDQEIYGKRKPKVDIFQCRRNASNHRLRNAGIFITLTLRWDAQQNHAAFICDQKGLAIAKQALDKYIMDYNATTSDKKVGYTQEGSSNKISLVLHAKVDDDSRKNGKHQDTLSAIAFLEYLKALPDKDYRLVPKSTLDPEIENAISSLPKIRSSKRKRDVEEQTETNGQKAEPSSAKKQKQTQKQTPLSMLFSQSQPSQASSISRDLPVPQPMQPNRL